MYTDTTINLVIEYRTFVFLFRQTSQDGLPFLPNRLLPNLVPSRLRRLRLQLSQTFRETNLLG